jgi:hypothetical protein
MISACSYPFILNPVDKSIKNCRPFDPSTSLRAQEALPTESRWAMPTLLFNNEEKTPDFSPDFCWIIPIKAIILSVNPDTFRTYPEFEN